LQKTSKILYYTIFLYYILYYTLLYSIILYLSYILLYFIISYSTLYYILYSALLCRRVIAEQERMFQTNLKRKADEIALRAKRSTEGPAHHIVQKIVELKTENDQQFYEHIFKAENSLNKQLKASEDGKLYYDYYYSYFCVLFIISCNSGESTSDSKWQNIRRRMATKYDHENIEETRRRRSK
jgi:hypothetical protein